ncbi:MAG: acyl carrier protein [Chloroflexi bacterium]|nr:MAG: acyl carrier protein [Chloroflexota bacterium]
MDIDNIIERYIVDEIMMKGKDTKIEPDQSLLSSGVIDSLSILRLIAFIEDRFGITVDDDEVVPENFDTKNMIKSLILSKM